MKYFINLLVIISFFIFSSAAFGDERAINATVDGVGTIINGNVASARKNAIEDALKKAIEEAVQSIVSSIKIAQNYTLLEENIYSKARGYTSNYKVTSEKPIGNMYQVTLEARVSTNLLEENLSELGLIASKRNLPRILVMIAHEKDDGTYHFWWGDQSNDEQQERAVEKIMVQKIAEKGYVPVDKSKVSFNKNSFSLIAGEKPGEETLISLGNQYNADIILYGKSYSVTARNENDMESSMVHAVVSLSLLEAKNGQLIASSENEELTQMSNKEEAFIKTAQVLAERVMNHIAAHWQNNSSTIKTVEMNISGIKSYVNFMQFQNSLKNKVSGVQGIKQKGFGAGGMAKLDITFKGNVQSLADGLTMISYEGFSIDITDMSHDKISIKMKKL